MRIEELVLHEDRNVRLTALLQETGGEFEPVKKRPAVIVLPGGGYSMCSDREADPVALAFAKAGYQAFILRYTVRTTEKERIWPHPIEEYDEAYDLIRANCERWCVDIDRIVSCGFSAGGHLAACTATIARNRPAATILGYPAILPDILDTCAPNLPRPVEHIDGKTPPCFIFAARDDSVVNVKSSTAFANALEAKGVTFELHIYSHGGHGYSTALPYLNGTPMSSRLKNWVPEALGFLEEVWGEFNAAGFTNAKVNRTVIGDYEDYLSLQCTIRFLEQQGESAASVLSEPLSIVDALFKARGFSGAVSNQLKGTFTLRAILEMAGTPEEKLAGLNEQLKQFPAKKEAV